MLPSPKLGEQGGGEGKTHAVSRFQLKLTPMSNAVPLRQMWFFKPVILCILCQCISHKIIKRTPNDTEATWFDYNARMTPMSNAVPLRQMWFFKPVILCILCQCISHKIIKRTPNDTEATWFDYNARSVNGEFIHKVLDSSGCL